MGSPPETVRSNVRLAVAGAVIAATPALLMFADRAPWEWLGPFLGRFHPVILHFPVALLFIVALLEVIRSVGKGQWHFPVRLLLFLASTGTVLAMSLGWLLANTDGGEGALIQQHRQGGITLACLSVATLFICLLAEGTSRKVLQWSYRGLLLLTCVVLLRTAHDGGSLTHGERYLTENAPWLTAEPPPAFAFPTAKPVLQWDVYAHVVAPILQARCNECHGEKNAKGRLSLENLAGIQRGGKGGAVVSAGNPDKSVLFQRMNLPLSHREHMPPHRKAQPSPEEMALLRKWIALGAPDHGTLGELHFDTRLATVVGQLPSLLRSDAAMAERKNTEELDPAVVAKLRAGLASTVQKLQAKYPGVLAYESRQSADLSLNAVPLGKKFGDGTLAEFAPLNEKIVWADLSGTAVTSNCGSALGSMKNLRFLRLANTAFSDSSLSALTALGRLESLNLFGTAVTTAGLPTLEKLPAVRRLYVGSTKIAAETSVSKSLRSKLIFAAGSAPAVSPQ